MVKNEAYKLKPLLKKYDFRCVVNGSADGEECDQNTEIERDIFGDVDKMSSKRLLTPKDKCKNNDKNLPGGSTTTDKTFLAV